MHRIAKKRAAVLLGILLALLVLRPVAGQGGAGSIEEPDLIVPAMNELFNPDVKGSIFYKTINTIIFGFLMFLSWLSLGAFFETEGHKPKTFVKLGAAFFLSAMLWYTMGDVFVAVLAGLRDGFRRAITAVSGAMPNVDKIEFKEVVPYLLIRAGYGSRFKDKLLGK